MTSRYSRLTRNKIQTRLNEKCKSKEQVTNNRARVLREPPIPCLSTVRVACSRARALDREDRPFRVSAAKPSCYCTQAVYSVVHC